MNVRKYFAADMRSALEMVRVEQGPDVLILSNRKLDNGVELITADPEVDESVLNAFAAEQEKQGRAEESDGENHGAADQPVVAKTSGSSVKPTVRRVTRDGGKPKNKRVDTELAATNTTENLLWTDEATVRKMQVEMKNIKGLLEQQLSGLAWADYGNKYPQRARLLRTLSTLGFAPALARKLVEQVPASMDMERAWNYALATLKLNLKTLSDPILSQGGRVAICGPTGVGKTTLVCKLAARYGMRHGVEKVTIVSLDDHRLGAHQQLSVFGRLSGIACISLKPTDSFNERLSTLEDDHLVLVDTGGFAPDDIRFRENLASLHNAQTYLALAATTEYLALKKALNVCHEMKIAGCLLTKVDETALLGGVISALINANMPLAYVSAGQAVPDDLEEANAKQLIGQAVAMGASCKTKADNFSIEHAFA